jgi:hypothetical protein
MKFTKYTLFIFAPSEQTQKLVPCYTTSCKSESISLRWWHFRWKLVNCRLQRWQFESLLSKQPRLRLLTLTLYHKLVPRQQCLHTLCSLHSPEPRRVQAIAVSNLFFNARMEIDQVESPWGVSYAEGMRKMKLGLMRALGGLEEIFGKLSLNFHFKFLMLQ